MQLAAISAINIGEHSHRVLRIVRPEHPHVSFGNGPDRLGAHVPPPGLRQIVVLRKINEIAADRVFAVRRDIGNVSSADQLVDTSDGSSAYVIWARSWNFAGN